MAEAPDLPGPVLLTEAHDPSTFESGEFILDDWLRRRALRNLRNAGSRTYVICPSGSARIVAYYSLSMGQILATDATGSMRRNMPTHIPAVVLGRLAIDLAWQRKGLGHRLLADAVRRSIAASMHVSARLLIVHAISPAAEAFYLHHGFARLPVEAPALALDLVKLQKVESA